jgi:hypothetical protein
MGRSVAVKAPSSFKNANEINGFEHISCGTALNWDKVGNGTFSNGIFSFVDPTATNFQRRFYRLTTPTP